MTGILTKIEYCPELKEIPHNKKKKAWIGIVKHIKTKKETLIISENVQSVIEIARQEGYELGLINRKQ